MILSGLLILFSVVYTIIYKMYKVIRKKHTQLESLNGMFKLVLKNAQDLPFEIDMKHKQLILYGYHSSGTKTIYPLEKLQPDTMLEMGYIRKESLSSYENLYNNVLHHKHSEPAIVYMQMESYRGWARITIISNEINHKEQIIGVIENYNEQMEKDTAIQQHLDNIKRVEKKSQLDFLTGLYNREGLIKKLGLVLANAHLDHGLNAFFILDLDNFKNVNDLLGHGMGDLVLQEAAHVLMEQFRDGDVVGRLGGDEFILYKRNAPNVESIIQTANHLNHALQRTYEKDGNTVEISASIGIALVQGDCTRFDLLYNRADKALYEVKKDGRNGYRISSE